MTADLIPARRAYEVGMLNHVMTRGSRGAAYELAWKVGRPFGRRHPSPRSLGHHLVRAVVLSAHDSQWTNQSRHDIFSANGSC
jgi:hypothetical protein